jgi:predicted amidophosphoribosyltransferase
MTTPQTAPAHTPGPWRFYENAVSIDIVDAVHSNGLAILEKRGVNDEQKKANARLMAAAPDLLDALKQAHDFIMTIPVEFFVPWQQGYNHEVVMNAIAKAEGR